MNILSLEAVSKSYGIKPLFHEITFGIENGQKIGLIGVNGTGKSTFLKVISGIIPPDEGRIAVGNHVRIQYLPQTPEFDGDLNVLDYVFGGDSPLLKLVHQYEQVLGYLEDQPGEEKWQKQLHELILQMDAQGAWDIETHAKTILTKLKIDSFFTPVKNLSGGQKKRVAMARAFIHPAHLLILDEPTNHIDHKTVEWLEDYLSKWKGALLLITHDRYFLDRVVDQIIELDQGELHTYQGNYSQFLEQKAARLEQLQASEDKRQNLMRRELAWLRRGAKARSTKQKARIERFKEIAADGFKRNEEKIDLTSLSNNRLGKKVIHLEHVSKKICDQYLIKDFNYIVLPADRLGIIGENGCGKSTLLNMIAGKILPDEGVIERGETVRIGYYDQESMNLDLSMKVIDYIKDVAEVIHTADGSSITASQMLEQFLFPASTQWTTIGRLSGGEKRRLYLLHLLMGEPNVLLLDEPTNDMDIQTLTILEEYLEGFPGAVLIVSHDRYFLDQTVEHLYTFEEDGRLEHYNGSYTEYLEVMKSREASAKAEKEPLQPEKMENQAPAKRKLSFKEQQEFALIEDKIAQLEEKNVQLLKQMEQENSDYVRIKELTDEQSAVAAELDRLVERWAELSEIAESL